MESLSKYNRVLTKTFEGEIWIAYDEKSKKSRPFLIVTDELSGVDVVLYTHSGATSKVGIR